MTRKQRRLALLGSALAVLGLAVGLVLVLTNPIADRHIAFFHELDEQAGSLGDLLALVAERAKKIRHFREYAFEEFAENGGCRGRNIGFRWSICFRLIVHGLLPR